MRNILCLVNCWSHLFKSKHKKYTYLHRYIIYLSRNGQMNHYENLLSQLLNQVHCRNKFRYPRLRQVRVGHSNFLLFFVLFLWRAVPCILKFHYRYTYTFLPKRFLSKNKKYSKYDVLINIKNSQSRQTHNNVVRIYLVKYGLHFHYK